MRVSILVVSVLLLGSCKTMLGSGPRGGNRLTVPVPFGPPPPKEEKPPAQQRPGYIWVAGYWEWLDIAGTYRWRPGHFVKARKNWEYRRPVYRKIKGQWYYTKPHWRRRHRPPRVSARALPPRARPTAAPPPPAKKKRRRATTPGVPKVKASGPQAPTQPPTPR